MSVVPTDVLPEHRVQKQPPNLEDLSLGGVIQTSDKNVRHDEVDSADDHRAKA